MLYIILEQTRTLIPPTYGDEDIIAIKFFPLRVGEKPFTIEAPTAETAWTLAKQSPFTRGRLIALQEKTSYDASVASLAEFHRANRILGNPTSPRAGTPNTNVQRRRNLSS